MKTVQRMDTVTLEKATFTPEGFLRDCPIVTRTGIFEYRNADGSIRREFRPHDEVMKAESLQSFLGKPVTLKHPNEPVTADNAKQLAVGSILSEGKADGENVRADVIIYDKATIESGKRELSCGYAVDLDMTPGEYNGQKYDCIQRNIRINHLAVVDSARAGRQARLNLDGDQIFNEEEEKPMPKIRLDNGLEYEAAPEVVVAFEKLKQDNADLQGQNKTLQTKLDTTEAERDTLKAENAKFDEKLKTKEKEHADGLNEAVKQRVSLLSVAAEHKIEKADEMTDREIKEAVIKAVRGDGMDLTAKSDEYVNAAFDLCKEDSRQDTMSQQRQTVKKPSSERKDEAPTTAAEARQKMIENQQNAYLGGKA